MDDPQARVAATADFGAFEAAPEAAVEGGADTMAARQTAQDDPADAPPSAEASHGTAELPPDLDRPRPGDQPLAVRFQSGG